MAFRPSLPRNTASLALLALFGGVALPSAAAQSADDDTWLDACGAVWSADASHDSDLSDPDEDRWEWDLGGVVSIHAIEFGKDNTKSDGLETRALDPVLRGRLGDDVLIWIQADLDGEKTRHNLREAWIESYMGDRQWLRAGQQRIALGTEFATRPEDLPLVGYSFPSWLDGRTDVGVAWDGYASDWSWFQLALTTGSGFDLDGNDRHDEQLMGRFTLMPEHDPEVGFDGFFGGFAASWMPSNRDEIHMDTPMGNTVFTTSELDADAARFFHAELGGRHGSLRGGVEMVEGKLSGVELPGGGSQSFDELGSWSAFMAYNFTGEAPRWYRGAWQGYGPDDHDRGQELPIEFAARYSNGDFDRDLFDTGIATSGTSTQEVRTFSAAISAFFTPLSRLSLQWTNVIADDDLATFGGGDRDSSWALRFDQRF